MGKLTCALEMDINRNILSGSTETLNERIAGGADLRISTGFLHNEHIDPSSEDNQLIVEVSTFAETVLIDGKWSAYFMTLRQPVGLRDGFGPSKALSLFLYNQDGRQAVARLILDPTESIDASADVEDVDKILKKMHTFSINDSGTTGLSKNFIYDFESFRYLTNECYEEVYANDKDGACVGGSEPALAQAYADGRGIKIAVSGISEVLWGDTGHRDEIFIHCSSSYYYTKDKLMITNSQPFISVPADIPLSYKPQSYRYCWMVVRNDGRVEIRSYSPFTGEWKTQATKLPIRWFALK